MSDQPASEPDALAGSAVLNFHVGDVRQAISAAGAALRLRAPTPRPAFGTDEDGNPRPDPTLAPAPEPEARASRAAPEKPPQAR